MTSTLFLRCSQAPSFRFALSPEVAILGRSARCDIVVDDPSISRTHAQLRIRESGLLVTDLKSRNGTFVDNLRIQTSQILCGQGIRFGAVSFALADEKEQSESEEETDNPCGASGSKGKPALAFQDTLSAAQRNVFDILMTGTAEKMIARRLNLSRHTVHNHVRAIFRTLGVHSRAELFAMLLRKSSDGLRST